MSLSDRLPGMRSDATFRNIVLGGGYLTVAAVALMLIIVFFPIIVAVAIGTNWRGSADKLARLPGIRPGGGIVPAVAAFVYGGVVLALLGTAGGGGDDSTLRANTTDPAATDAESAATSSGTVTLTRTGTATTTATKIPPTPTTTPKQTSTPKQTPAVTPSQTPPASGDIDCSAFDTRADVQAFYENHNPSSDPHQLDRDRDGIACESISARGTTHPPAVTAEPTPNPTETTEATATQAADTGSDSPIDGGTARRATVVGVVDADTIDVRYENGARARIRLVGVDSPEPNKAHEDPSEYNVPATARGYEFLDHWAHEASDYAQDRLAGEHVLVVTDPVGDTKGGFGRTLAYVYIDGENFGQTLIEQGLARRYDDAEYVLRDEYGALEEQAQHEDVGVWGFESRETPEPTPEPTPEQPPEEPETSVDLPHRATTETFPTHTTVATSTGIRMKLSGCTCRTTRTTPRSLMPMETVWHVGSGTDTEISHTRRDRRGRSSHSRYRFSEYV